MWRGQAGCPPCGQTSPWRREREESRQEILRRLQEAHGLDGAPEPEAYQIAAENGAPTAWCLTSITAPGARGIFTSSTPAASRGAALGAFEGVKRSGRPAPRL